jgi:hypothetical protein
MMMPEDQVCSLRVRAGVWRETKYVKGVFG